MQLVLASTSPFRQSLLQRLGLPFVTFAPNINEIAQPNETPQQLVTRLATAKARVAQTAYPNALIIGSDQVSVLDGRIIGKPGNHANAVQQLQNASGRRVRFLTGLCVYNSANDVVQTEVVPFEVQFRNLSATQIENYLLKEQPYNCAGSFKSEGLGIALFDSLHGDDPTALIGLPLIRLVRMLENQGVGVI